MPRVHPAFPYIVIGRMWTGVTQSEVPRPNNVYKNKVLGLGIRNKQTTWNKNYTSVWPRLTKYLYLRVLMVLIRTVTVEGILRLRIISSSKFNNWLQQHCNITTKTLFCPVLMPISKTEKSLIVQYIEGLDILQPWFSDQLRFTCFILQTRYEIVHVYRHRRNIFIPCESIEWKASLEWVSWCGRLYLMTVKWNGYIF